MTAYPKDTIVLFWSFRSPYSYFALPRLSALSESTKTSIDLRIVHPNILRNPNYFKSMHPLARAYFMRDTQRTARVLGMPFRRPIPDPIHQDPQTFEVAADQPLARRLGHLGIFATEAGYGFAFCVEVSRLLWDGTVDHWDQGHHLERACQRIGLDWTSVITAVDADPCYFEMRLKANADALSAAGHWGVPTMVFRGETFFGQDRIDQLAWTIQCAKP
jgi:2-hydroxychromene-2-carboxylate isomerase